MGWYLQVLKNYAVFTGRARRKEYWMFVLFNVIFGMLIGVLDGVLQSAAGVSFLRAIYELAIIIPAIAVGVRRMHDTDHSGWWLLFPLVNLVFACTEGTPGPNRFGADPKVQERRVSARPVFAAR